MTTAIAKKLYCIQMRSGVELWVDEPVAEKVQQVLNKITGSKFLFVQELQQTLNTADIVGVFSQEVMEENNKRKNGMWKCRHGAWHDRGEKCQCLSVEERQFLAEKTIAINQCTKCDGGWVKTETGMAYCEHCLLPLMKKYGKSK